MRIKNNVLKIPDTWDQHMTTVAHFWATKEAWKRTKKKLGSWWHSQWIKRMSYVDEYYHFQEIQQKHACTNNFAVGKEKWQVQVKLRLQVTLKLSVQDNSPRNPSFLIDMSNNTWAYITSYGRKRNQIKTEVNCDCRQTMHTHTRHTHCQHVCVCTFKLHCIELYRITLNTTSQMTDRSLSEELTTCIICLKMMSTSCLIMSKLFNLSDLWFYHLKIKH